MLNSDKSDHAMRLNRNQRAQMQRKPSKSSVTGVICRPQGGTWILVAGIDLFGFAATKFAVMLFVRRRCSTTKP
jgi:hypothetical protein